MTYFIFFTFAAVILFVIVSDTLFNTRGRGNLSKTNLIKTTHDENFLEVYTLDSLNNSLIKPSIELNKKTNKFFMKLDLRTEYTQVTHFSIHNNHTKTFYSELTFKGEKGSSNYFDVKEKHIEVYVLKEDLPFLSKLFIYNEKSSIFFHNVNLVKEPLSVDDIYAMKLIAHKAISLDKSGYIYENIKKI
ncbi:MAG: hypothetical protein ACK5LV_11445 [Lachnospirales bacterium]